MLTFVFDIFTWVLGLLFKPKTQVQTNTDLANKVIDDEANRPTNIAAVDGVLDNHKL